MECFHNRMSETEESSELGDTTQENSVSNLEEELNTSKKTIQELSDTIQWPSVWVLAVAEGEERKA